MGRIPEWWNYLLPFLLGIGYIIIFILKINPQDGIPVIGLFVITISSTVFFGYLLNDYTDQSEDKLAGKRNLTTELSSFKVIILMITTVGFAISPWWFLPKSQTNILLYILQIILLLIYSVPPIRLKRHPYVAIILDSLYNSTVPVFVIGSTFFLLSEVNIKVPLYFLLVVLFWAFLKGTRGILLHQVSDRKNDKKASCKTFVLRFGPSWTINLIKRYTLPAETLLFIFITCLLSYSHFPYLWVILPIFGLNVYFFLRLWEQYQPQLRRDTRVNDLYIINNLYEKWLPIAALIYLPFLNIWYLLLYPIHFLLFYRSFSIGYRNLLTSRNNYSDFKKYLMRRKYKSISAAPPLPSKSLSTDNKIVHGLWIGPKLSVIELLTIKSFIYNGHDFHLWNYGEVENLPDGVISRDANQIIPQKDIIVRKYTDPVTGVGKGSVGAPFSDLFRYKLLFEEGGWWVDMDVTCLRPLDFSEPYFFRNHSILDVIGNVMKCPKGSELMRRTYEETRDRCDENTLDWLLPNKILNKHIRDLDLLKYRKEGISNRDQWPETKKYLLGLQPVPPEWHIIHWSNEEFRMNKLDKDHLKFNNTTLGLLIERNGLTVDNPKFWPMVKNNIRLSRPFRLDGPALAYSDTASMLNRFYHIAKKPFLKAYWYFHGHVKYYMDKYL